MAPPDAKHGETKTDNPAAPEIGARPAVEAGSPDVADTVRGKFDDAKKDQLGKLEHEFEDRRSAQLGEKAIDTLNRIKTSQLAAIEALYAKYQAKVDSGGDRRTEFVQQLFDQATKEGAEHVDRWQKLFERMAKEKGGDKYLNEKDIAYLETLLPGMEKIIEENPKIAAIHSRLVDGKDLHSEDYQAIIAIFNPNDVAVADIENPQKAFEASSAGLLVALMGLDQRMIFMEELMKSSKKNETPKILDGFLRSGILTPLQGEAIVKKAETAPAFSDIATKLQSGFYAQEAKKQAEAFNGKVERLSQQYAVNPMERFFGAPGLGFAAGIHGALWLLVNLLNYGKDIGGLLRSPWPYAAAGELALGIEISTGGAKRGTGSGVGYGAITSGLERAARALGTAPVGPEQQETLKRFSTFYSTTTFRDFFDQGGAEKILALQKKTENQQTAAITVEGLKEMIDPKKNPLLGAAFERAQTGDPEHFKIDIITLAEFCRFLNISDAANYTQTANFIRRGQGVSQLPAHE